MKKFAVAVLVAGVCAYFWPREGPVALRGLDWSDDGDSTRFGFMLVNRIDQTIDVEVGLLAERRSEGRNGSKVAVVGHTTIMTSLAPREEKAQKGVIRLASGPRGALSISTRIVHSASNHAPEPTSTATSDRLGHIDPLAEIKSEAYPCDWGLKACVYLEAGALEQLYRSVSAVFPIHENAPGG